MNYFVFDVESIGLHGEGFAVGWVVVRDDGTELECGGYQCPPDAADGTEAGEKWVKENVPTLPFGVCPNPKALRESFWEAWQRIKATWDNPLMVADCAWPVEARFLIACIDDDHPRREWEGPYPLHDLASICLAIGKDPLGTNERLPSELPAHNPLADARQSARLLCDALKAGVAG